MKILVTGGLGFIGSAFVRTSIKKGHQVINIDSLTYAGNVNNVNDVKNHKNYFFKNVDIKDFKAIEEIILKFKPDSIIHLAAETHVDQSIKNPKKFLETNIIGTFNLLQASKNFWFSNNKPKNFRFLHVSTDEVFGSLSKNQKNRFTEKTPYDPRSPYSVSKASSDHLVKSWYHTYKLPIIVTNCSNNYGPFHFPEKLIPLTIINAILNKHLPIYGDGKNIRDWLYVDDHILALLVVLEKGIIGESYNIGSENEITNLELVHRICDILDRMKPKSEGKYNELITFVNDRPGHDFRYAIDPRRIQNELGWKPKTTLEKGLEYTVNWFLEHEEWWRPLL